MLPQQKSSNVSVYRLWLHLLAVFSPRSVRRVVLSSLLPSTPSGPDGSSVSRQYLEHSRF